jgi:RND family efflux transporter MFP subunit
MSKRSILKKIALYGGLASVIVSAPAIGLYANSRESGSFDLGAAAVPTSTGSAKPGLVVKAAPEDFVAVLLPPQMADLSQRAQGRVTKVYVKVGQLVRKNDVLVELDPRDREQDLKLAQAGLYSARAQAGAAGAAAKGAAQLAQRQNGSVVVGGQSVAIVAASDADQARANASVLGGRAAAASADVAVQQERVNLAKLALEETRVSAPFDGVVTQIMFEAGNMVNAGDLVARVIANGEGWRARIAIPEEFASLVNAAKRANLKIDSRIALANIEQHSVEVDPASRTFMLEGKLANAQEACGGDCTFLAGREVRATLTP